MIGAGRQECLPHSRADIPVCFLWTKRVPEVKVVRQGFREIGERPLPHAECSRWPKGRRGRGGKGIKPGRQIDQPERASVWFERLTTGPPTGDSLTEG